MHYNAIQMNNQMEKQITIRLSRELSQALKEKAARMQRKPSELVRIAVKEFLVTQVEDVFGFIDAIEIKMIERDSALVGVH